MMFYVSAFLGGVIGSLIYQIAKHYSEKGTRIQRTAAKAVLALLLGGSILVFAIAFYAGVF